MWPRSAHLSSITSADDTSSVAMSCRMSSPAPAVLCTLATVFCHLGAYFAHVFHVLAVRGGVRSEDRLDRKLAHCSEHVGGQVREEVEAGLQHEAHEHGGVHVLQRRRVVVRDCERVLHDPV